MLSESLTNAVPKFVTKHSEKHFHAENSNGTEFNLLMLSPKLFSVTSNKLDRKYFVTQ